MWHDHACHDLMRSAQVLNEINDKLSRSSHDDHARAKNAASHMIGHAGANGMLFVGVWPIIGRRWKSHDALFKSKMGLSARRSARWSEQSREARARVR